MKYFIMKHDIEEINPATTIDSGTLDPLDLIDGKVLLDPGELHINLSPRSNDDRGDFVPGVVTLFHEDLIDELNRLNIDNLQYFPVHMHAPDGMIEKAYSIANVIGLVDAVDISKSRIKPRAHGGIGSLYSFSIDEEKVKGLRIFRILHATSLIIIDESLYKELTEYNPPGVLMYPTEEYDGWG